MVSFLDSSHSFGDGVVSHYELNFISLMTNDIEYIFHMLITIHISSLEKCLFEYFVQDPNHETLGL